MPIVSVYRGGNITEYIDVADLKAAPLPPAVKGFNNAPQDVVQLKNGKKYSWLQGDITPEALPNFVTQTSDTSGIWGLDTPYTAVDVSIADATLVVPAGSSLQWNEAVGTALVGDRITNLTVLPAGVSVVGSVEVDGTVKLVFVNPTGVDATINPFNFQVVHFS